MKRLVQKWTLNSMWPSDATGVLNLSWLQESWDWITDIGFAKSDIWHTKKCNIKNRIWSDKWSYSSYFCHHFWCYQFQYNDRHWLKACWLGHLLIIGSLGHMSIIWAINLWLSSVDISPSWPLCLGPVLQTVYEVMIQILWGHDSNLMRSWFKSYEVMIQILWGHDSNLMRSWFKSYEVMIQILWGHDSNLVKMHFTLILLLRIKSGHDFAHATTAELSWHVQNYDLVWYVLFT